MIIWRSLPVSWQQEGARPPHRAWEYPAFATASRASRRELGHSPRGFPRIGEIVLKKRSPGQSRGLVSVGKHDLESHVLLSSTPRVSESRGDVRAGIEMDAAIFERLPDIHGPLGVIS
jgi:hypothetical protein